MRTRQRWERSPSDARTLSRDARPLPRRSTKSVSTLLVHVTKHQLMRPGASLHSRTVVHKQGPLTRAASAPRDLPGAQRLRQHTRRRKASCRSSAECPRTSPRPSQRMTRCKSAARRWRRLLAQEQAGADSSARRDRTMLLPAPMPGMVTAEPHLRHQWHTWLISSLTVGWEMAGSAP